MDILEFTVKEIREKSITLIVRTTAPGHPWRCINYDVNLPVGIPWEIRLYQHGEPMNGPEDFHVCRG